MAIFSKPLPVLTAQQRTPLLVVLATVLLLRSRLVSVPKNALLALKSVAGQGRLSKEELDKAQQQLYVKNEDGTTSLLVPYRGRVSKVSYFSIQFQVFALRSLFRS